MSTEHSEARAEQTECGDPLGARRLPWRVRIADAVARRLGDNVAEMDHDAFAGARRPARRPRPPLSWITGPVLESVTIGAATAVGEDGRSIALRTYRPRRHLRARLPRPDALPVVVFLHGGGWALGSTAGYDPLATSLSDSLGALVVGVDYRLAPHDPAPAGLHDCLDATRWIGEHARELGGDPERVAVCGDSAGGNLATVIAQIFRDDREAGRHAPRLRHQALIYPSVDCTRLTPSKMALARGPIMTRRDTDAYLRHYLGVGEGGLSPYDPRISPALGRLDGLPPTLIQVAEFDPLRDEGIAYAQALREAGVEVVCTQYDGAVHGFASFPGGTPGGFSHRAELTREIGRHLL